MPNNRPLKVLITGASGLLGRSLMAHFAALNPMGYAFSRAEKHNLKKVDLTDKKALLDNLTTDKPDIIIHAAAERHPSICTHQPDRVQAINVEATATIAAYAQANHAWLLFISTDYIFDGANPPHLPNDPPNPLNAYGASKLAAEQIIKATTDYYGILRISVLYGKTEYPTESAVTNLLSLFKTPTGYIDNYYKKYPIHVDDVAAACWDLCHMSQQIPDFHGCWHYNLDYPLTRFDMLTQMAAILQQPMPALEVIHTPMDDTPRPVNSHLDCSSTYALGIKPPRAFHQGIAEVIQTDTA